MCAKNVILYTLPLITKQKFANASKDIFILNNFVYLVKCKLTCKYLVLEHNVVLALLFVHAYHCIRHSSLTSVVHLNLNFNQSIKFFFVRLVRNIWNCDIGINDNFNAHFVILFLDEIFIHGIWLIFQRTAQCYDFTKSFIL